MREAGSLFAAVDVKASDAAAVGRMVKSWLEGVIQVAVEVLGIQVTDGMITTGRTDGSGFTSRRYDEKRWIDALALLPGGEWDVSLSGKGPAGRRFEASSYRALGGLEDYSQLDAFFLPGRGDQAADALAAGVCELAQLAAGHSEVPFAYVGLDGNPGILTALDVATRGALASRRESAEWLRGYGWVTVCSPPLLEKLGGAAALEATGAFADIEVLPGGNVLLKATRDPREFDERALEAVWRALAPALPRGLPRKPAGYEDVEVVERDAADVG
ncbi:hypothetical protein [Kribbella endophytica]